MAKTPPPKKTPPTRAVATRTPAKAGAGRPAGLLTWIAVGLVVVVVAALVIIKVSSGSSPNPKGTFQPTDAATLAQLTAVPTSVFDTVGVTSTVAAVTKPITLKGQPLLTGTSSTGATLPKVFYLGSEYCPFCAAERWPTIIALSRFGTWSGLGDTISSTRTGEAYPGTPSFTFWKANFTSTYLTFSGVEQNTNIWSNAIGNYTPLQTPSKAELANFKKYDTSKYIPGSNVQQNYSIPYLSIGNQYLISGASYTPAALANLTRSQIASSLSDPTNPVTQAIIADANLQTATFCTLTKNLPASVCSSKGVMAAKKVMGIK